MTSRHTLALAALMLFAPLGMRATLITNGDFESGNTGFTSSYTYVAPGGGSLVPPAVYTVDNNPRNSHGGFFSMGDHTTGTGLMMIINGSTTTGIPVWEGSVTTDLVIGQQYDFSAWVASVNPASPAQLTFTASGASLGTLSPDSDGSWKRLFTTFTATEVRPTFRLVNSNGAFGGNDFAIDDLDVFLPGTTTTPGVPDSGPGMIALSALIALFALGKRRFRR